MNEWIRDAEGLEFMTYGFIVMSGIILLWIGVEVVVELVKKKRLEKRRREWDGTDK